MNRFSKNGDGKERAPNHHISSQLVGKTPANTASQGEPQLIEALKGRYDQIESLWNEAEADLKRFRVPHGVEHCYHWDCDKGFPYCQCLWWMRYGKGWRIVHETRYAYSEIDENHPDECEWKPIIECPLDFRLSMIAEFEHLRKKVIEAAEKAVPTLDAAISSFQKILKR